MMGADPEFAVWDRKEEKFVPAHTVGVPGRTEKGDGGFFRDGFGLEFNPLAWTCIGLGLNGLRFQIDAARHHIAKHVGEEGRFELRAPIAVQIDPQEALKDAPRDVLEVGCNPSFNIYDDWLRPITAPWTPQTSGLRMFAGHMHFSGYKDMHHPEHTAHRVRALDLMVGVPLTYIFQDEPLIFERRKFYGKAGEFRLQKYGPTPHQIDGLEYRTPGAELFRHMAIAALFFAIARKVVEGPLHILLRANDYLKLSGDELDFRLQSAINTGEGLEELLLPFYYHGLPGYNPQSIDGVLSHGNVSLNAIKKLREIREETFGPETTNLLSHMVAAPKRIYDLKARTYRIETEPSNEGHVSWPEFPLLEWGKHFAGMMV